jgi:HlyD family secretion protein
MEARVDIGEMDVVLIAVGQKAHLEVDAFKDRKSDGVVTDIANSAKNNDTSNTAPSSSGNQTQDATKFQVKIRLKDKGAFLPGMSVTAEIETRSRTNVVTVPIQSVTRRLPKDKGGKTNAVDSVTIAQKDPPGDGNAKDQKPAAKLGEPPKPVEVVFVVENGRAKMVTVKHGIEDDNYEEIVDGLTVGQEVISGGSKAINRDLEDGKKVIIGSLKADGEKAN